MCGFWCWGVRFLGGVVRGGLLYFAVLGVVLWIWLLGVFRLVVGLWLMFSGLGFFGGWFVFCLVLGVCWFDLFLCLRCGFVEFVFVLCVLSLRFGFELNWWDGVGFVYFVLG